MPLPLTNLRDCTEKCRSKQHGKLINAALTKRSISDRDLCSYLDNICCCCDTVKDYEGQTALHVSVSCGRSNVVKWLAKSKRANINLKDSESGFTPLHKSIFYGKIDIAVQLIKFGANLSATDFDGYTVLENAMLDLTEWKELAKELMPTYNEGFDTPLLEIYAWGSNANYTFGPQQERVLPERLEIFHKHNPGVNVRQICLEKFHCVILTTSGEVFASGHGHGGRLGFENEKTVIVPEKVKFPTKLSHVNEGVIEKVSISVDHSIFLSSSGHVWTCGQNTHCVLGINPPPLCVLKPHQLHTTQHSLENVLAAKYHSIAWGPTALYTWGLNGGQLGHHVSAGKYIITPKVVPHFLNLNCSIRDVTSSNAAIAVLTSNFDIYVLHQYNCNKITANHLSIRTFGITGGKISAKIDNNESIEENHELVVVINNTLDHLYVWSELTPTFTRCIFSGNRCFKITQLTLNLNEILFVTNFGEAYRASFKSKIKINIENENALLVRKNNANKILHNNTYQVLKVTKIPHIHRALSIHSDIEGRNFACLQVNPTIVLNNATRSHIANQNDQMHQLLIDSAEDDCVHDIVFKVSYRLFPAHHYIISSKCTYLHELIKSNNNKVIELFNIDPLIFEQILLYIYTDACDLMQPGPVPSKFKVLMENQNDSVVLNSANESINNTKPMKDPIRMLQEASKTFELNDLHKFLKKSFICDNCISTKNNCSSIGLFKFNRRNFPELHNVTLRTIDNNNVKVHKCILVAKMEYFNNLFSQRWKENSKRNEISFPYPFHIVDCLIDYLYTDELPNLKKKDLDFLSNLLVVADEFFLKHMKDLCEDAIISHITLKSVATIFSFSHIYNADHLKMCCMRFICYNLPTILESKCLEVIDDELLWELTNYYNDFNSKLQQRIITPYMDAPSDEIISEIAKNNPIKLDSSTENFIKTAAKHKRKRLSSRKSISSESNKTELNLSKNDETLPEISNLSLSEIDASPKEESFSKVQIRVKALVAARQIVGLEDDQNNFETLKPKSELALSNFPELMDHSPATKSSHKSEKVDFKQKMPKLSQKQRKRLSSESNLSGPELSTSPVMAETPKNPWKVIAPNVCNSNDVFGNLEPTITMESIITAEIKQKENFIKMKTKLLAYTQIEDKAIDDLKKFYNVDMVSDEVITVNRVQTGLVASPVWVPIKK